MRWKTQRRRRLDQAKGEDFCILHDREVALASKGDSTLPIFLRRITIRRDSGEVFDIISNDAERSALDIALCYKARWQIELFFKWIKQNLNIRHFIGRSENAVRLQILSAMIAYLLLGIAHRSANSAHSLRHFAKLASLLIHTRRDLATIEHPPPAHPSKQQHHPNQIELHYA